MELFMTKFNFVSHESFPQDEYTKELVYLDVLVPVRVAWVRKAAKTGGLFWSPATTGVTSHGQKEYFPSWMQDSNFLEKEMKEFLEKRKWETLCNVQNQPVYENKPTSMDEVVEKDSVPF